MNLINLVFQFPFIDPVGKFVFSKAVKCKHVYSN